MKEHIDIQHGLLEKNHHEIEGLYYQQHFLLQKITLWKSISAVLAISAIALLVIKFL